MSREDADRAQDGLEVFGPLGHFRAPTPPTRGTAYVVPSPPEGLPPKGGSGRPALNQRTTQGKNLAAKAGGTSSRFKGATSASTNAQSTLLGNCSCCLGQSGYETLRPGASERRIVELAPTQ